MPITKNCPFIFSNFRKSELKALFQSSDMKIIRDDLKFSGTQCIKSKLNSVTNIREKSWGYNEDIINSICFLGKVIKVIIFFLSNQVILMVVLVLWPYVIFWHTGAANCPNLFWTRVSQPTNPPREIPFLWELESLLASS